MKLNDLRALVTIVDRGSFTAAAAEIGYTQSAISQQIRSLEREAGRPLLERRPLRLTPAGTRLVGHARRILVRRYVARAEFDDAGPPLRISACPPPPGRRPSGPAPKVAGSPLHADRRHPPGRRGRPRHRPGADRDSLGKGLTMRWGVVVSNMCSVACSD